MTITIDIVELQTHERKLREWATKTVLEAVRTTDWSRDMSTGSISELGNTVYQRAAQLLKEPTAPTLIPRV